MFDQMEVENEAYQIKPMNCPFHCLIYKDTLRSYRDLPFRWAELGTVYRYSTRHSRLISTHINPPSRGKVQTTMTAARQEPCPPVRMFRLPPHAS